MDEKNDAVVTEREVFLYILDNPGSTKAEIIAGLHTNAWQVARKLRKLCNSNVITENGTKKFRNYKVVAEFVDAEPTFKKEINPHRLRYVPRYKPVIAVYKRMLAGDELDNIDTTDEIKATIRLFERYKSRSAYQICELTGIHVTLAADLRLLNRQKLRKNSKKQFAKQPSVGWAVRQIAIGTPLSTIGEQVTIETLNRAITFIKMANAGAQYFEIGRAIGIKSHQVKPMLKVFESKYAEQLKNFDPEKYLVQSESVKVIM